MKTLRTMFETINASLPFDEVVPLTVENSEYYGKEIANLIDGGLDISEEEVAAFFEGFSQ